MPSVSIKINNVHHPLVKSFRFKQDFTNPKKAMRVLIIEPVFNIGRETGGMNGRLMNLLADLQDILPHIEKRAGKFDCIDICPPYASSEEELRLSA